LDFEGGIEPEGADIKRESLFLSSDGKAVWGAFVLCFVAFGGGQFKSSFDAWQFALFGLFGLGFAGGAFGWTGAWCWTWHGESKAAIWAAFRDDAAGDQGAALATYRTAFLEQPRCCHFVLEFAVAADRLFFDAGVVLAEKFGALGASIIWCGCHIDDLSFDFFGFLSLFGWFFAFFDRPGWTHSFVASFEQDLLSLFAFDGVSLATESLDVYDAFFVARSGFGFE
jgi:hypothetical protein